MVSPHMEALTLDRRRTGAEFHTLCQDRLVETSGCDTVHLAAAS